jgi:hypothetical protein
MKIEEEHENDFLVRRHATLRGAMKDENEVRASLRRLLRICGSGNYPFTSLFAAAAILSASTRM